MSIRTRTFAVLALLLSVTLVGAACGSDDKADSTTTTTKADANETTTTVESTTTEAARELVILVSNDDGVGAPGISALVTALAAMPDTEVLVSAPAEQQSGTGGKTTPGTLTGTETTTAAGYPAYSVPGFPADSVNWALDGGVPIVPDLVVTGINSGQNLGGLADQVSGTVGAARAAVAHGIPALATSMGESSQADYALAATYVVKWIDERRPGLLSGEYAGDGAVLLMNLNVPHCREGAIRGEVEVALSPVTDGAFEEQNCASTEPATADDITSFNIGFVTLTDLPIQQPAS